MSLRDSVNAEASLLLNSECDMLKANCLHTERQLVLKLIPVHVRCMQTHCAGVVTCIAVREQREG